MIRVDFQQPAGSIQPDHQALRPVFGCAFDAAVNEICSGRVDGGVKGDDVDGLSVYDEGRRREQ